MQILKQKNAKKQTKQYVDQNPIEALTSVGTGVLKSFKQDLGHDSVYDAWDQILGNVRNAARSGGELIAGEEIDLEALKIKEKKSAIEPGIDYIREVVHTGEKTTSRSAREVQIKIQEILIEIKQLANSSS